LHLVSTEKYNRPSSEKIEE